MHKTKAGRDVGTYIEYLKKGFISSKPNRIRRRQESPRKYVRTLNEQHTLIDTQNLIYFHFFASSFAETEGSNEETYFWRKKFANKAK